jgi:hypothetical protein
MQVVQEICRPVLPKFHSGSLHQPIASAKRLLPRRDDSLDKHETGLMIEIVSSNTILEEMRCYESISEGAKMT